MKKVVALVLSVVMMLSVVAFAAETNSVVNEPAVLSVEPADAEVGLDAKSELAQSIVEAISEVGMNEAFGSVLDNPEEYNLLSLSEFKVANADEGLVIRIAVPGVKADDEVVVLLGIVANDNVNWDSLEVVSVEDGVVTVSVTAEQASAVNSNSAVLAVLVK